MNIHEHTTFVFFWPFWVYHGRTVEEPLSMICPESPMQMICHICPGAAQTLSTWDKMPGTAEGDGVVRWLSPCVMCFEEVLDGAAHLQLLNVSLLPWHTVFFNHHGNEDVICHKDLSNPLAWFLWNLTWQITGGLCRCVSQEQQVTNGNEPDFVSPQVISEKYAEQSRFIGYPLVNIQKPMENHIFLWINPLFLWPNCLFTRGYCVVLTRTILAMGVCIWSFIDCSPTHTTPTLFDTAKYLGPICDTFHDLAVDLATVTWRQGFWILAPRAGVDFGRPSRLEHSAEERRQGQRFPDRRDRSMAFGSEMIRSRASKPLISCGIPIPTPWNRQPLDSFGVFLQVPEV